MSYFDAYQFPFRRVGWLKNILLLAVCQLIPIVGPLAMLGYMRIVLLDVKDNASAECPEFSFDRFGDYISWGIWPFVAALVTGLVLVPIIIVMQVGIFVVIPMHPRVEVLIGLIVIWFAVYITALVLVSVASYPIMLRAMLMQEFGAAFNFAFIKDFLLKMWLDMLLKQLFMMVTSIPVMIAGICCCIVGVYPAMVIVMLAGWYLQAGIYKDYLARGGMEIPIKPVEGPPGTRAFEVGPGPGS